jgi:hypothetical protein
MVHRYCKCTIGYFPEVSGQALRSITFVGGRYYENVVVLLAGVFTTAMNSRSCLFV